MTKILCSVCDTEGVLQVRGNSARVQHYVGYVKGKRVYSYHNISSAANVMEVNGSKTVEVNSQFCGTLAGNWSLRRDLDPRPLPYQGNAPPG